jgi:hypothetical protein
MKKLTTSILFIAAFLSLATPVHAVEADPSAKPAFAVSVKDNRAERLRGYLAAHNSPLVPFAEHFVAEADRMQLDWKLVAAIAGVESTFGAHIPSNSYNGWGWGIFTGASDGIHFAGWKDGITQVSEGLRHNYVDKGATSVEEIGHIYAASPAWSTKVRFFLKDIEGFTPRSADDLAVTI